MKTKLFNPQSLTKKTVKDFTFSAINKMVMSPFSMSSQQNSEPKKFINFLDEQARKEVSAYGDIENIITSNGGKIILDHFAHRSISEAELRNENGEISKVPTGITPIMLILQHLGFKVKKTYSLDSQITAIHSEPPSFEKHLPKSFLSQIPINHLPQQAQDIILEEHVILQEAEEVWNEMSHYIEQETKPDQNFINLAQAFMKPHLTKCKKSNLEALVEISTEHPDHKSAIQYIVWVLNHGFKINHMATEVSMQHSDENHEINDINKFKKLIENNGIKTQNNIVGFEYLSQFSSLPEMELIECVNGETIELPGSYHEMIARPV